MVKKRLKIILEIVSKGLKSVKIVVLAVMMTVQQSFSVIKNPVTMVSDRWSPVILNAVA